MDTILEVLFVLIPKIAMYALKTVYETVRLQPADQPERNDE